MQTSSETLSKMRSAANPYLAKVKVQDGSERNSSLHSEGELTRVFRRREDAQTNIAAQRQPLKAENAAISDEKFQEMLAEQAQLASKKVCVGLSHAEQLQLQMVRWAIGRAEAARYEEDLNRLQALTSLHEELAAEVTRLVLAVKK